MISSELYENSSLDLYSFTKNKIKRGINLLEPGSGYLDYKNDCNCYMVSLITTNIRKLHLYVYNMFMYNFLQYF